MSRRFGLRSGYLSAVVTVTTPPELADLTGAELRDCLFEASADLVALAEIDPAPAAGPTPVLAHA